jgi:mono/diheme cytochrome c family protein
MAYLKLTRMQGYTLALLTTTLGFSACLDYRLSDTDAPPPEPAITVMGQEASLEMLARGAELYAANCQSCHGDATGGALKDIPPPHNANGHTWHHADQQLTEMILNGITFSVEQQKMPGFKDQLSEEDVRAILAYIKTWWMEEQREWQKKATENWGR